MMPGTNLARSLWIKRSSIFPANIDFRIIFNRSGNRNSQSWATGASFGTRYCQWFRFDRDCVTKGTECFPLFFVCALLQPIEDTLNLVIRWGTMFSRFCESNQGRQERYRAFIVARTNDLKRGTIGLAQQQKNKHDDFRIRWPPTSSLKQARTTP